MNRLKGRAAWTVRVSTFGSMIGALLASAYTATTLRLEDPSTFGVLVAIGIVVLTVLGNRRIMRRMKTLRGLESGAVPDSEAARAAAVGELSRIADYQFWTGIVSWGVGAAYVGLGMRLLGAADNVVALRIALLGVIFGPITSMFMHLMVTLRARDSIRVVAEGLSPQAVQQALPPNRTQLRARLLAFTVIAVIMPAVIAADAATSLTQGALQKVAAASEAEQELVAQDEVQLAIWKVVGLGALVVGVALVTAYVGATAVASPMREIALEANRIAQGEFGSGRPIPAEDEVWAVSSAFAQMRAHLTDALSQLKAAGIRIGATTEEIVATSTRYEAGATTQATSLNETSATTEELARSAKQIADNAASVADIAQRTLQAAQAGQSSAVEFSSSMGRMQQDNQAIADSVAKLNKRVQAIGRIVEFINGIADKSDLLALNAELEGTKAGDVGRGFSLVAAEMRRLAENVIESTREIEGLIEEIRDATRLAVEATSAGLEATQGGVGLAESVTGSLAQIVELAQSTSDAVRAISLATQQQQSGTDQLAEAMSDIMRVTHQSLTATKEVARANNDLSGLAKDLKDVVDRFKVSEGKRP